MCPLALIVLEAKLNHLPRTGGHDLERFLTAQHSVYDRALAELRRGRKTGHWMWFIFPQLVGLGQSEMSRFYAISDPDEAKAYLAHQVLGARLRECADSVLANADRTAEEIFGSIDAVKSAHV